MDLSQEFFNTRQQLQIKAFETTTNHERIKS